MGLDKKLSQLMDCPLPTNNTRRRPPSSTLRVAAQHVPMCRIEDSPSKALGFVSSEYMGASKQIVLVRGNS